jgi:hypothetical protein
MTRRDLTADTAQDKFNVEAEARLRGIQAYQVRAMQAVPDQLVRDIVADAYKGISQSASMIKPERKPPPAKGSGWVDPAPMKAPTGIEYIDRMCEAQDRADRIAAVRRRIENAWIEDQIKGDDE